MLPTDYVGGFLGVSLHALPVECKPFDLAHFNPPSGQTCLAYAGDWVASSGGYLVNPNATSDCESPAVMFVFNEPCTDAFGR